MLERGHVPGAQGHGDVRHRLVLGAPYPAHDPREQAHQAQAGRRMPSRARFCCHSSSFDVDHSSFDVDAASIYGLDIRTILLYDAKITQED